MGLSKTEMTARAQSAELEELYLGLTTKQRLYVEGRLEGLAPSAARAAAGYDATTKIYELESHPKIKEVLFRVTRSAMRELTLGRNDVLQGFMDAVDSAATSTELVMAWREIGKVIGAYEPEVVVHKFKDVTPEKIAAMSDEDLLRMSAMENFKLEAQDEVLDAEYEELSDE